MRQFFEKICLILLLLLSGCMLFFGRLTEMAHFGGRLTMKKDTHLREGFHRPTK